MSNIVEDATATANAMVTAAILRDYEAFKILTPDTRQEAFYTMVALARVAAASIDEMVGDSGDALDYWREVIHVQHTLP